MTETTFSANEWLRYTKQAHIVIVGAGGLGCPSALYLAAAGVGCISIVDGDRVDLTNLQRQIAFDEAAVGTHKAQALKSRLDQLNSEIDVTSISEHLTQGNAESIIQSADLVLDCTDNFATRYLINDVCYQLSKPWVMASIGEFYGQSSLFNPNDKNSACFRCLFPQAPSDVMDCNSAGVIGVLPGMLAMYQTCEAIKYLVGLETPLKDHLLIIDAMAVTQKKFQLQKNKDCRLCSNSTEAINLADFSADYQMQCASDSIHRLEITVNQFEEYRQRDNSMVLDVRTNNERESFNIGGLHIPLDQLEHRLAELVQEKHYLVYCQSGIRSLKASQLLNQHGFENTHSLAGGLLGWLKNKR